ncbi:uncharacterized protein LOC103704642 isoform X1 [Phoenix dactylifera]|uniref:Uncharacterized protein LOC103704642 isoform X1 n=1 Tax=Phoenix dactylifera TaxID=42345 RepID=A0A8B7BVJ8_PHODC|nr:uncharacterized protein LOC103704642 isoform X1 [Phoenix dactylifera]
MFSPLSFPFPSPSSSLKYQPVSLVSRERERGGLEMACCNGEDMASQGEEASLEKKYGGIAPKKKPLISKAGEANGGCTKKRTLNSERDHERSYFDSADWALGKQGANLKTGTAIELLKPKLQRTPHHQLPPRNPKCTSSGESRA